MSVHILGSLIRPVCSREPPTALHYRRTYSGNVTATLPHCPSAISR